MIQSLSKEALVDTPVPDTVAEVLPNNLLQYAAVRLLF